MFSQGTFAVGGGGISCDATLNATETCGEDGVRAEKDLEGKSVTNSQGFPNTGGGGGGQLFTDLSNNKYFNQGGSGIIVIAFDACE